MQCEYDRCIYWRNNMCRLKSISIGPLGLCLECIVVDFGPEVMEKRRQEMLARLDPDLWKEG